jgi:hypothetical protein
MTLNLTLSGETLGEIIDQMRFLLDTVRTDEGRALLAALHGDLGAPKRRNPKSEYGLTLEQAEASIDASAPPCSPDEVRDAMRAYLAAVGEAKATETLPMLLGAPRVSDIPPTKLWRARRALETATAKSKRRN